MLACAFVVVSLAASARASEGQSVRGVVRESETAAPIEGALVVLIDATGAQVASVLSSASGGYAMRAPVAGTFTVRAERIGFETAVAGPLALGPGDSVEVNLSASARVVSLDAIEVSGSRRCSIQDGNGPLATWRVWQEARKALAAMAATEAARSYRVVVELYTREMDPGGGSVRTQQTQRVSTYSGQPFGSRSAAELQAGGYVRAAADGAGYDFYAPDAHALLSDAFLGAHCMLLTLDHAPPGSIGLAFEPIEPDAPGAVADIRGVFWLDRVSAELGALEFTYVNLGHRVPVENATGRVEFAQLAGGAWAVRRWWIRTPMIELRRSFRGLAGGFERAVSTIREQGGEVIGIRGPGGEVVDASDRAVVAGTVYDSTRLAPLADAEVRLAGTAYSARTDSSGRFRMAGVAPGRYRFEYTHARLDSLGWTGAGGEVEVEGRRGIRVDVAVPPLRAIRAAACATLPGRPVDPSSVDDSTALVVGVVRDGLSREPLAGAAVRLEWADFAVRGGQARARGLAVETRADSTGRYRVCGVPMDRPIRARIDPAAGGRSFTSFTLSRDPVAFVELSARAVVATLDSLFPGARLHITSVEHRQGTRQSAITGRVLDIASHSPVAGATVRLDGAAAAVTDTDGGFRITKLDVGNHVLTFEHLAYGTVDVAVGIVAGTKTVAEIGLPHRAVAVSGVEVETARSGIARNANASHHIVTGIELEQARARGAHVSDVIAQFPALRMREGWWATQYGVEYGPCVQSTRRVGRLTRPAEVDKRFPVCEMLPVYVDAVPVMNPLTFLRNLRLDDYEAIEFVPALEAQTRFGLDAGGAGGALLLRTRK